MEVVCTGTSRLGSSELHHRLVHFFVSRWGDLSSHLPGPSSSLFGSPHSQYSLFRSTSAISLSKTSQSATSIPMNSNSIFYFPVIGTHETRISSGTNVFVSLLIPLAVATVVGVAKRSVVHIHHSWLSALAGRCVWPPPQGAARLDTYLFQWPYPSCDAIFEKSSRSAFLPCHSPHT